jgi:hypothetical protein
VITRECEMKKILLAAALIVFLGTPVLANCIYEGKSYPTGTRIGPLVCTSDGTWRPAK